MIKAVLFDMDGLMIDSRPLWLKATTELLAQFGMVYDPELAHSFSGRKAHDVGELLRSHYGISASAEHLALTRNQIMIQLAQQPVDRMPGLTEVLALLAQLGHKKAVATSSYQALAHQLLISAGVFQEFEVIVTGEDVIHGKPAPDIFLHAATKLGVRPENCLVLEDAVVGIDAAYAAGMLSIAINDHLPAALFPHASYVFPTLHSVNQGILESL